jgi:hypothetical protein
VVSQRISRGEVNVAQKDLRQAPGSALSGLHGDASIYSVPSTSANTSSLQDDVTTVKRAGASGFFTRALQLVPLLLVLIAILLVALVTVLSPQHLAWNEWGYSEWLINYDAGFIRRGLSGAVIDLVGGAHLPVVNMLVFVTFSAFCLLFWWVLGHSARSAVWAVILAMLLPNGPVQMAASNEIFYRKEIAFHVALGISCVLYQVIVNAKTDAKRVTYSWILFALLITQTVVFPLFHEVFLFISFPASWLLARQVAALQPQRRVFGMLPGVALVISLGMMVVSVKFAGNQGVADQIWMSLSDADRAMISPSAPGTPTGGIAAIGWSLLTNLTLAGDIMMSSQYWIWGFAAAGAGVVLAVITSLRRRESDADGTANALLGRHLSQLWFLFLASVPMYVLGYDWARWISSVAISFLFLSFADSEGAIKPPALLTFVPRRWRGGFESVRDFCKDHLVPGVSALSGRHKLPVIALALFYCLTFRPPECCMKDGYNPYYRAKPLLAQLAHLRP